MGTFKISLHPYHRRNVFEQMGVDDLIHKKIMCLCLCLLIVTACSNVADKNSKVKYVEDPVVTFQGDVIPVIEEVMKVHFPNDSNGDVFFEQATSYFDNDNSKVVFLFYQENAIEMNAFRKELEEKLGDKVIFKKAKYSPKLLSDTANEVRADVESIVEKGRALTVSYNPVDEVIEVEALLTDEQIADLKKKFGEEILRITNQEPERGIAL